LIPIPGRVDLRATQASRQYQAQAAKHYRAGIDPFMIE